MKLSDLDQWLTQNRQACVDTWMDFLRFPSVSADPGQDVACCDCAAWLRDRLAHLGFKARLLPTAAHPLVMAERPGVPDQPSVLIYGHYDVQPADPLDQWVSPPFEPQWRGDRLYARGAQDNKGQIAYVLAALEALVQNKTDLPPIRILFEGDEECGRTAAIDALSAQNPASLRADILYNCDALTVAPGRPTITMGLRGLAGFTVEVQGATRDLHSGVHGGKAPNAATVLARLIASLHDETGRIAVAGYYDGVTDPTPEERTLAKATALSDAEYEAIIGIAPLGGEKQFSSAERAGFRPTIEINGFHSGYGGPGSKTVIPAVALAKITLRLAAGQDPEACYQKVTRHLTQQLPAGLKIAFSEKSVAGIALKCDLNSPLIQKVRDLLSELSTQPPAFLWEGGSIPIMARLPALAGAQPLIVGFGAVDDNIHAPNESFSWNQYRMGFLFAGRFLATLSM
jgi:acetylornithine deacetylase/succinyl-diaminopimelate desuccinylase-like protein